MPSRGAYGEVASISNCTDYQSRRLNAMYTVEGRTKFLHTLNGTAIAVPRILMAILETHANDDGTGINIPEALHPFLGGITTISVK